MTVSQPKRTFRVPIFSLMLVVVAAALGSAALARPSVMTHAIVVTSTFSILLIAILGALRGRYRTFALGFAVLGWSYLFLAMGSSFDSAGGAKLSDSLITTKVLKWGYERVTPRPGATLQFQNVNTSGGSSLGMPLTVTTSSIATTSTFQVPSGPSMGSFVILSSNDVTREQRFLQIGHMLSSLVHGLAGGLLLVWFEKTQRKAEGESL